ncbi:MAG TPA: hypothetical protein VGK67_15155 [Myxococcales bacterium]
MPTPPCPFDAIFPDGADLGTVRLLSPGQRLAPRADSLSPLLVPLAEAGERDLFALYDPPEAGARSSVVCAVDRDSGVWAPLASTFEGFAAWLLLLRRAQASLPGHAAFAVRELMEETEPAAQRLAQGLGLELETGPLEPDRVAIAERLLEVDRASPWACSILARSLEEPKAALSRLAPALLAAPFSAGLLEQTADLSLDQGQEKKAARALLAAMSRLEPNLQAAPYRLDEPDEETGALFEPFQPVLAFRFLQENSTALDRDARRVVAWEFFARHLEGNTNCELPISPTEAVEAARRRGLGGDLPGGRWILHLALGQAKVGSGRARLLEELGSQWELAGSKALAARCRTRAAAMRAAMEAAGRVG